VNGIATMKKKKNEEKEKCNKAFFPSPDGLLVGTEAFFS
jgi:hypothetical protein